MTLRRVTLWDPSQAALSRPAPGVPGAAQALSLCSYLRPTQPYSPSLGLPSVQPFPRLHWRPINTRSGPGTHSSCSALINPLCSSGFAVQTKAAPWGFADVLCWKLNKQRRTKQPVIISNAVLKFSPLGSKHGRQCKLF